MTRRTVAFALCCVALLGSSLLVAPASTGAEDGGTLVGEEPVSGAPQVRAAGSVSVPLAKGPGAAPGSGVAICGVAVAAGAGVAPGTGVASPAPIRAAKLSASLPGCAGSLPQALRARAAMGKAIARAAVIMGPVHTLGFACQNALCVTGL